MTKFERVREEARHVQTIKGPVPNKCAYAGLQVPSLYYFPSQKEAENVCLCKPGGFPLGSLLQGASRSLLTSQAPPFCTLEFSGQKVLKVLRGVVHPVRSRPSLHGGDLPDSVRGSPRVICTTERLRHSHCHVRCKAEQSIMELDSSGN